MMKTVALAVCTLPQTTLASLTIIVSSLAVIFSSVPCRLLAVPASISSSALILPGTTCTWRMVARSPVGSASSLSRVSLGMASNAELAGANTVSASSEFSVSTRPAASTAVTRVDSSGLVDAAVATGSWAIASKLPASPSAGTSAQPGPKLSWLKSADADVAAVVSVDAEVVSDADVVLSSSEQPARIKDPTRPNATMALRGLVLKRMIGFLSQGYLWAQRTFMSRSPRSFASRMHHRGWA